MALADISMAQPRSVGFMGLLKNFSWTRLTRASLKGAARSSLRGLPRHMQNDIGLFND